MRTVDIKIGKTYRKKAAPTVTRKVLDTAITADNVWVVQFSECGKEPEYVSVERFASWAGEEMKRP